MLTRLVFLLTVFSLGNCDSDNTDDAPAEINNDKIELKEDKREAVIRWNEQHHLEWADFRKPATSKDIYDAKVKTGIAIRRMLIKDKDLVSVYSLFLKDSSYSKVKKQSDGLLVHENAHFALTEITARDFRERIAQWDGTGSLDEFIEINLKYFRDADSRLQEKYDFETNHGLDTAAQRYWNNKIDSLLTATNSLSNPTVTPGKDRRPD